MLEFKNHHNRNFVIITEENVPIASIALKHGVWTLEVREDDCTLNLCASDLRQIADKLDELNGVRDEQQNN